MENIVGEIPAKEIPALLSLFYYYYFFYFIGFNINIICVNIQYCI